MEEDKKVNEEENQKAENNVEEQEQNRPVEETDQNKNQTTNMSTKDNQPKKKKKFDKTIDTGNDDQKQLRACKTEEAEKWAKIFEEGGKASLHVLDKGVNNPRYPGFSTFFSSNVLQNSSYCWTMGKDARIKDRSYKKLNDRIYNLPDFKNTRFTMQGFGKRDTVGLVFGKGSPSPDHYQINTCFDFNIRHNKGSTMLGKSSDPRKGRPTPGPGAYNLMKPSSFGLIPITVKSRQGFFYDWDLKKKKYTVGMQKYHPKHILVERRRFNGVGFGIGERNAWKSNGYPGPGTYNVPSIFDRGLKGKLVLN